MDDHFSAVQCLLKKRQKSDSFSAHFGQHFKSTMSHTDFRKCMTLKVLNQINPIGAMKSFAKPNCNICLEGC